MLKNNLTWSYEEFQRINKLKIVVINVECTIGNFMEYFWLYCCSVKILLHAKSLVLVQLTNGMVQKSRDMIAMQSTKSLPNQNTYRQRALYIVSDRVHGTLSLPLKKLFPAQIWFLIKRPCHRVRRPQDPIIPQQCLQHCSGQI